MSKTPDLLIKALKESYALYLDHGPRSTARLHPIHGFFHEQVEEYLKSNSPKGKNFVVSSQISGGEKTVEGLLYKKRVDVAVSLKEQCVGAISLKFVMTNYKQNANNYFEHLMGETANIRSANIPYSSFTIIPMNPLYLSRGSQGQTSEVTRVEQLTRKDVQKYINLYNSEESAFRPDPLGLLIIDMNGPRISISELQSLGLSASELASMKNMADPASFIQNFCKKVLSRSNE